MKKISAGALLFAIITSFVISIIAASLILLATNQYKLIDDEVDRIIAYYRAKAGMENAIYWAYTNPGALPTGLGNNITLTGNNLSVANVTITITRINGSNPAPFSNLSSYGINVTTNY